MSRIFFSLPLIMVNDKHRGKLLSRLPIVWKNHIFNILFLLLLYFAVCLLTLKNILTHIIYTRHTNIFHCFSAKILSLIFSNMKITRIFFLIYSECHWAEMIYESARSLWLHSFSDLWKINTITVDVVNILNWVWDFRRILVLVVIKFYIRRL